MRRINYINEIWTTLDIFINKGALLHFQTTIGDHINIVTDKPNHLIYGTNPPKVEPSDSGYM